MQLTVLAPPSSDPHRERVEAALAWWSRVRTPPTWLVTCGRDGPERAVIQWARGAYVSHLVLPTTARKTLLRHTKHLLLVFGDDDCGLDLDAWTLETIRMAIQRKIEVVVAP